MVNFLFNEKETSLLALRLEQATKVYGVPIVICESTMKEIADHFQLRELDLIQLKGVTVKPGEKIPTISIYQVSKGMEFIAVVLYRLLFDYV